MTIPTDIIDGIKLIMSGDSGDVRTIPSGVFKYVSDDDDFDINLAVDDPRPYYIEIDEDEEGDSDLSGDYRHFSFDARLSVVYADKPHDRDGLESVMDRHRKYIRSALVWPRNWALVTGWTGCEMTFTRQAIGDETEDIIIGRILVANMTISYREDMS